MATKLRQSRKLWAEACRDQTKVTPTSRRVRLPFVLDRLEMPFRAVKKRSPIQSLANDEEDAKDIICELTDGTKMPYVEFRKDLGLK